MQAESVTNWDHRIRLTIFFVMCVGMSIWFGYDGVKGYPASNLEWAKQEMPGGYREGVEPSPRAQKAALEQVREGMSLDELRQLLGEPSVIVPRQLRYVGEKILVTIEIGDDGKVLSVQTRVEGAEQYSQLANDLVTPSRVERVVVGASEAWVRGHLGKPVEDENKSYWYVGPAAYGRFHVVTDKVVDQPLVRVSEQHSEGDIALQKILGAGLGILGLYMAIKLVRVYTTRVVVDSEGLLHNRKRIPWGAMVKLRTDDYMPKGWVDLDYESNGRACSLRLDSYHLRNFDNLLSALCEGKGFEPLPERRRREDQHEHDEAGGDAGSSA